MKIILSAILFICFAACSKEGPIPQVQSSQRNVAGVLTKGSLRTDVNNLILGKWYILLTQTSYTQNGQLIVTSSHWDDGRYRIYNQDLTVNSFFTNDGKPVYQTFIYEIINQNTLKDSETILTIEGITDKDLILSYSSTLKGKVYKYTTYLKKFIAN
jgi:hypothetical protein